MVSGGGPEQAALYSALSQLGMEELAAAGGLLGALLDCATEGFDSVIPLPRRKLCAFALCKVRCCVRMRPTSKHNKLENFALDTILRMLGRHNVAGTGVHRKGVR